MAFKDFSLPIKRGAISPGNNTKSLRGRRGKRFELFIKLPIFFIHIMQNC